MNYPLLLEERKSYRSFAKDAVLSSHVRELKAYHDKEAMRLFPGIATQLMVADADAKAALETAAGYKDFMIGAPRYAILLSAPDENAFLNGGYLMEDLSVKLNEMGYGTCFLTFRDGEEIKEALAVQSEMEVVAILAFGVKEHERKRIHVNIHTMSNISIREKQQYFAPKKSVEELVSIDSYGNKTGLAEFIGFYDDMLWEAFIAAANAPSYMNRQPYTFLIRDGKLYLLEQADEITPAIDAALNLGIVMQHFAAIASAYIAGFSWRVDTELADLPDGVNAVALCEI